MLLWNFNQRWRTGSIVTLLDSQITQVSFQIALYCWVCQMLHETSFQIINLYSINGQNWKQSHCDTSYSRGGVNQMCILKNSKDLLEYIQSSSLSSCNSIKIFDISTLYTTIPHSKLKDRLRELVKYLVLGRDRSYFVKKKKKQKKNTLILPKSSMKLISSTCTSFWLTTYLFSLVDVFFNRQSAYIMSTNSSSRRLVPLFVWGRLHTRASQEKRKEASTIL
jgi:hypothetical protein